MNIEYWMQSLGQVLLYPEEGWARTATNSYWLLSIPWWNRNRCKVVEVAGTRRYVTFTIYSCQSQPMKWTDRYSMAWPRFVFMTFYGFLVIGFFFFYLSIQVTCSFFFWDQKFGFFFCSKSVKIWDLLSKFGYLRSKSVQVLVLCLKF